MLKVQKELVFLKNKANEHEFRLKKDERIMNLEKSLEWFRDEALKLGKNCQTLRKDIEKWKAKAENLEDDKSFLEKQIMSSKRQNKLLKVALSKC